ncbi:unnamed protein product [Rhizoctonia solani]|uniref:Calcium-binding protein NCS-1 n=1 Tax=Rhizoctonia solani TaxID=456999 RepID=A0A8H2XSN0_9AGAM|nr:unnamed protein product [Rhizoctonia solani]
MGNKTSKLSQEQLAELQKNTYFDKKELQQWYKGFLKDCPSGQLDKHEFSRIYKQFFPFGDPGQFADYVFNVFDNDKNGTIDFKEFIGALSVTSRGRLDEKLKWAFQLYDIDGDGFITYDEMLQIVRSIYKMTGQMVKLPADEDTPEKRVDKIFRNMDRDKDARLTYDEFVEGSKQDPTIVQALSLYDGTMRVLSAVAALAVFLRANATPNTVPFENCLSSQTYTDDRYNSSQLINVTNVYSQITDIGDGNGRQLRLSFISEIGSELDGWSSDTKLSTTLIYSTSIATSDVFWNKTFFCYHIVPPVPYAPRSYNDTDCIVPAGPLAFGIQSPLPHDYQLVTLNTRVQVLDTSNPAKELACIDVAVTPIVDIGVGGSFDYAGILFWVSVGLAIAYWLIVGLARIAAAWRRGSWDSNQRWVYIRWAGTVLASAISGERLAASPALLRFATPSMRDIIFHTQWCACLAMVAVEWPNFIYPILSNAAWSHLLYNVTIIQGENSANEHWWPLRVPAYTPPDAFSAQMENTTSPIYIDPNAPNSLFTFPSYPIESDRGLPALAAAVGLREQDLFGMCVSTFLAIVASTLVISVFIWAVDWLISSVASGKNNSSRSRGVPANGGGDVKDVVRSPSPDSQLYPGVAARSAGHGHARRGWWRYRLGQSSFHGSVLHGNLVRLLLLFHLPVTIFSCYQFTLGRSTATTLSIILAALTFAVFSIGIPLFLIYRVTTTPTGKLYDATRTLLALGPLYNHYGHGSQLFAGLFFANNIALGSVIGAGQKSGTAQSIIILVIEVASALATSIWLPWGKGAHMSLISFLFCVLRIISSVLLVILSPVVAIGDSAGAWIAYAILIIAGIIYITFIVVLFFKILEGLVRLIFKVSFDRSHHSVDTGFIGALGLAGCCGSRSKRKRRSRGHRYQLSGSISGSSNSKAGLMGRSSSGLEYPTAGYAPGPPGMNGNHPIPNGPYGNYPPSNGLTSYPPGPAPQSYLRPEQIWQSYQEADEDDAGHIMQSWNKHQTSPPQGALQVPPASQPGPAYQPVPTNQSSSSGFVNNTPSSSGFSRVKGGRAHYESPFAIRAPARPSPLSSQIHLPPGARPPEQPSNVRQHSRTRSQTAVIEDAARPVQLAPSTLPLPQIAVPDEDDSPASSEPTRRRFWFGRSGGRDGSQDDTSSGTGTGDGIAGPGRLWPFGKKRRGSEADVDWTGGAENSGGAGAGGGGGFVVMRKGGANGSEATGVGGGDEEPSKPSFSVIRQPRPGTGNSANSAQRQSTIG